MLPVSVIISFDFGIVPTMWYCLFFISFYIFYYLLISFLRLVDDDMFTFHGFKYRSRFAYMCTKGFKVGRYPVLLPV